MTDAGGGPLPAADDEQPRGLELLAAIADELAVRGLPLPPIPETMLAALTTIDGHQMTSRDDPTPGAWHLQWFVDEAVAGSGPDYVLFGDDGHGLNSWGFHWYLVAGPAAIFVQVACNGIETFEAVAGQELEAAYRSARTLIEAVLAALDAGRLDPDERVLVVDSFAAGRRWARQAGAAEPTWPPADDPYGAALVGLSRRGEAATIHAK